MKLRNDHYTWPIALVLGSAIVISLFNGLREQSHTQAVPESVVEIDFVQWHEAVQKAKSNPVITAPDTARVNHVIQHQMPIAKPITTPVTRQPVVAAQSDTPDPPAVRHQEERPEISRESPQAAPFNKDDTFSDDLPMPAPIFQLTSMPRFAHKLEPRYPASMRSLGREAQVNLEILVDAEGKVRKVTVLRSGGDIFDDAARSALLSSTFIPGNIEGKPVAVSIRMPVTFRLN